MTIGRIESPEVMAAFERRTPISHTRDWGETWTYEASEFPPFTSSQRAAMIRLREGPILICTYTDTWKDKEKRGLPFTDAYGGEFTGRGLFAALSFDDGKTWPVRRLVTPGGPDQRVQTTNRTMFTLGDTQAEPVGYMSATQSRDGLIHLVTSKNHYVFNLAWIRQLPPDPG
jgi:hypothetical protein